MKNRKVMPFKSIFFHLTLVFLVLGLFPLLVSGIILYEQFKKDMEQVVLQDMEHMALYAEENIEKVIDDCNNLTNLMYDLNTSNQTLLWELLKNEQISPYEKKLEMNIFLTQIMNRDSSIRSVFFIDNDNTIYYVTNNTQKVLNKDKYNEFYNDNSKYIQDGLQIYNTHVDSYFPGSQNNVITFKKDYKDVSEVKNISQVLGSIYIDIDLSKFSSILQNLGVEKEREIRIIDENRVCIFSNDKQEINKKISISEYYNGQTIIYSAENNYYVITPIKLSNWLMVVNTPYESMMKNITRTQNTVILFLFISFFVLFCFYIIFFRKFREPVKQLEVGMNAIQNGDLSTRVNICRNDEIGLLADGFNKMAEDLETYIKQVYIAKICQRNAELDALKSQIKPHYLYNTLDVIRMKALENNDEETALMVESLSRQLKYLIGHNYDIVKLSQELNNIREYFYIIKIRYGKHINLEIDADEDTMNLSIIKLSLQPIVENAVKYGLKPKKDTGTVRITIQSNEEKLEIIVMDDGVGIEEDKLKKLRENLSKDEELVKNNYNSDHLGLRNVSERIKKNFGNEYGIQIDSFYGMGTVVTLNLPSIPVSDN